VEIYLFFDFDDTLSEQISFNLKYVRAIGTVLAPNYGGDVEAWAKSAIDMMEVLEAEYIARFRDNPLNGYCKWLADMRVRSTELLFTGMGQPVPDDAAEVSIQTQFAALIQCDTLFPGAKEAIWALHARGIPIHMASGNSSDHLQAALQGVGLDHMIDRKFGPDLIDCAKEGPEFYERILADMDLPGDRALFIDNDPTAIDWAHAAGAAAIQVKLLPDRHVRTAEGALMVVTDLRQLPNELMRILAQA
jgi:phosphoglycolate phosphatase-like HAD superfamily hydrolase